MGLTQVMTFKTFIEDGALPYGVEVTGLMIAKQRNQMEEWCIEHFDKDHTRWYRAFTKFFFRDESDLSFFLLRWSK